MLVQSGQHVPGGQGPLFSLKWDHGETPKRNLLLSSAYFKKQSNCDVFLFVQYTTILSKYNHPPLIAAQYITPNIVHNPKYFLVVTIMDGDFTEGGEKRGPALNELTV